MMRILIAIVAAALLTACDQLPGATSSSEVEALHARVQRLEDESRITHHIALLDQAVDDKDWDAVRPLFADQVATDFSSLGGSPGVLSADDLVSGWSANLYAAKLSFHITGPLVINVDGDSATAETNGYAWNALPAREGDNLWEVWGRYKFTLERSGDDWRIVRMDFNAVHQRGDPAVRAETARQ